MSAVSVRLPEEQTTVAKTAKNVATQSVVQNSVVL